MFLFITTNYYKNCCSRNLLWGKSRRNLYAYPCLSTATA